jgi:hypothetical protein
MAEADDRDLIRFVRRSYQRPSALELAARARLDEHVRRLPRPQRGGTWPAWPRWFAEPGLVPLAGIAAALLLVAVGVLAGRGLRPSGGPLPTGPDPAIAPAGVELVRFELAAPAAATVALVGDFNDWDVRATPMRRPAGGGRWTAAVPMPRGRHVYAFIVDGVHWVGDPLAPRTTEDDFGSPNAVIVVGAPEGAS